MLRLPAVAGRFYPSEPSELATLVNRLTKTEGGAERLRVHACLVPHAGYAYSGLVAGAVFSRIAVPPKILILGVRHFPRGQPAAILSSGAWRTPLGDAPIDEPLAQSLLAACPLLREDSIAHSSEHSLEVQLPFLQVLAPGFTFVPVALGMIQFEALVSLGEGIAEAIRAAGQDVLLLTTSDLNHYESEAVTREKDRRAIQCMLNLAPRELYDTCRNQQISMCGLGPAVIMLTVLNRIGAKKAELVKYATSADASGETKQVVGYAGMFFS